MDLNNFEYTLLNHLENQSKDCYNDINSYSQLIHNYYGEKGDIKTIRNFVSKFNIKVLNNNGKKNYELFEGVLRHKLFDRILYEFRNSDILVLACREGKEDASNWLMTMDINTCVQDANGCSALMYACKNPNLIKVVNYLCDHDKENIQIVDSKGQNAAFYAVENLSALRALVNHKIDINRTDYNYDSVLTYCCRNKIYDPISVLAIVKKLDLNIFNDEEKTAAMYLIEDEKTLELKHLITKDMNFYYKNSKNETALSILFAKYARYYDNRDVDKLINIIKIIKILIDKNINLNTCIDEEGNTPFMYFLMYRDWCSIIYFILHCFFDLDFQYKNARGVSAAVLSLDLSTQLYKSMISSDYKLDVKKLLSMFIKNPTFGNDFVDENGNNLLMYAAIKNSLDFVDILVRDDKELIEGINMDNETILIICAKLGLYDVARNIILKYGNDGIDHQDKYGNTALHYAILCNDYLIANLLAHNKADLNIKNFEGVSPMDLAKKDHKMDKYMKKPVIPSKMVSKVKKSSFKPVNENLRNKYRESYTSSMPVKDYGLLKSGNYTRIYEKSIKIYFNIISADPFYDFSSQYVANCNDLISMSKKNAKFFAAEVVLDAMF